MARPAKLLCLGSFFWLFLTAAAARAQLISTADYGDTFTLGVNGRANGVCCAPVPYAVEDTHGNPASTWTPQINFSFNDIPGSFGNGPTVLAAATGNPGADTGVAQSGGGDFSFAYGLRTDYVVQVDAFLSPGDRTDISSVPTPGAGIFSQPSLSVFFRRDSIAGRAHPAFPLTGLPGIGIYNGSVETAVTDCAGVAVKTGIDDDNWHNLAVHFNQDARQLKIYVDGKLKADLDLTAFEGGLYQDFSNGAVGAGGAGAFVGGKVLWFDNFQVGAPGAGPSLSATFSASVTSGAAPLTVDFDASCAIVQNPPATYSWDFGDGMNATGKTAQHTYTTGDNYTVTLTVKDALNNTDSATRIITVFQSVSSFSDDFNRPAGPVDGWTVYQGAWQISDDGRLGVQTPIGGAAANEAWIWAGAPPPIVSGDFQMEFEMEFLFNPGDGVGRHAGVFFFAGDPTLRWGTTGYDVWWIDRGTDLGISIRRWDGGRFTFLTPGTFELIANPPRLWRIEVEGAMIRVIGDGVQYVEIEDNTYRDGLLGFWAYSNGQDVRFDNLRLASTLEELFTPCFTPSRESAKVGDDLTFDAACSKPAPAATITSYEWNFGDGATKTGQVVEHTYAAPDIYTVTLTLKDSAGNTGSATRTIAVYGPVALPYEDNFNRPAGPVDGWTVFQGAWQIDADGKLAIATPPPSTEAWIWAGKPAAFLGGDMNAEFEMEFRSNPMDSDPLDTVGRHAGFQFHCTPPTQRGAFSGYFVDWIDRQSDRGVRFTRVDNGRFVEIIRGQGPLAPPNPPLLWQVQVEGPMIRAYGDGILYIEVEDSTYREGFFGFWAYSNNQDARFDNLKITGGAPPSLRACFSITTAGALQAGSDITFDAGCSRPAPGAAITSYEWNFGDGQTGTGPVAEHTYAAGDSFTVTLTVKDSAGGTNTVQRIVRVLEPLLPFADCFDRPAGPVGGWTAYRGDWSINADGKAQTVTAGSEHWLWAGAPPALLQGDFTAEFDLEFAANPADGIGRHGGVMFFSNIPTERFDAASSGYVVWWIDRLGDLGLTLARFDGNAIVTLHGGTFGLLADPPRTWRLEVAGPKIKVSGDDVQYIDVEDTTYREGFFGAWAYSNGQDLRLDNVRLGAGALPSCQGAGPIFRRGDVDSSGAVDISDPINELHSLFLGDFDITCQDAADFDDSGEVDISDAINSLLWQFASGLIAPPPGPFNCGLDPTPDKAQPELGCASYNAACGN